jgi:hypothetical protein
MRVSRRASWAISPSEPDDVAIELGIGLQKITELVRRYQDDFEWNAIAIGKLKLRS